VKRVYLSPPHMGGDERALLAEAFDSNWIAPLGPHVDAFEKEMAEYLGVGHAAALSSGTAALHLAMRLLGVGAGDEVLCSTFTFSASVNPIVYEGGRPVLVDCDAATWTMDPNLLEDELRHLDAEGRRPKAVIAVDLYGQCADYDRIGALCERYGVPLVEDAAEALGSVYKGKRAGRFGRLGVLSFNGNKIITTSGGGMLLTDEKALIAKARFLATQAREAAAHYEHREIGFNYRMSNLLAAVGRGQLRVLPERVAARRRNFRLYVEALGDVPGISFMPEAPYGTANRWLTCVLIDPRSFGVTREDMRLALEREDIESRPLWKPMHMQPVFSGCRRVGGNVSASLFQNGLCLPSGSALRDEERNRIVDRIRAVARVA
jgi:dTDP-4-amino-4,6-dideoxygalactose transaminase